MSQSLQVSAYDALASVNVGPRGHSLLPGGFGKTMLAVGPWSPTAVRGEGWRIWDDTGRELVDLNATFTSMFMATPIPLSLLRSPVLPPTAWRSAFPMRTKLNMPDAWCKESRVSTRFVLPTRELRPCNWPCGSRAHERAGPESSSSMVLTTVGGFAVADHGRQSRTWHPRRNARRNRSGCLQRCRCTTRHGERKSEAVRCHFAGSSSQSHWHGATQ